MSTHQQQKAAEAAETVAKASAALRRREADADQQRAYRNDMIRQAFRDGASWGQIMAAAGLTKRAIAKIRAAPDAPPPE